MVLMTGKQYREKNKARMLKLRNEMAEKGYKQLTHFFSEAFRNEITRITKEQKITKTESLEYIFQGYLKNSTNTIQEQYKEKPQSIEKIENNINPAPEPAQKDLEFADQKERPISRVKSAATLDAPPMDPEPWQEEEYKNKLFNEIYKLKQQKMKYKDIAEILKQAGYTTITGLKLNQDNIKRFYLQNKDLIKK